MTQQRGLGGVRQRTGVPDGVGIDARDFTSPKKRRTIFRRAGLLPASSLCLAVTACSPATQQPQNDGEKLVQAALSLLSGGSEPLCINARTAGPALSVFRTIATNPPAGATPPAWFLPATFSPPATLSNTELYSGAQADGATHIDQPTNSTAPVAPRTQTMLDSAALQLSAVDTSGSVTILPSWQAGMKARGWLRNRISFHCSPNYQISNPAVARDIGFVTVTANHWGTTYAFQRSGSGWVAKAQWSNWLY